MCNTNTVKLRTTDQDSSVKIVQFPKFKWSGNLLVRNKLAGISWSGGYVGRRFDGPGTHLQVCSTFVTYGMNALRIKFT